METKKELIQRLYEKQHITFEEVIILQRDTVGLPQINTANNCNNIYSIPKPQIKDDKII